MESTHGELFQFLAGDRSRRQTFRTVWAFNIVLALVMFGLGGIVVRQWIVNHGKIQQPDGLILLTLAGLLYFIVRAIQSAAAGYVTSSDIAVSAEGVQIFLRESHPRMIPWDAFSPGTITPVKPLAVFRPRRDEESAYAIHISSLSLPFRLAGLSYGQGWRPIFLVTPDHELSTRLLDQLKQHHADQADHV